MNLRVAREGDAVRFSAWPEPAAPAIKIAGRLGRDGVLRVAWSDPAREIELTRRTPAEAAAFFPRPPNEAPYEYRPPPDTGDGWATARAGEVGIEEGALTRLVRRLIATDPSGRRPSLLHSILVARRGKLVLEEYLFGFDREKVHDTRSAGKTFASVLLGAAMRRGAKVLPDTKVYELLAGRGPFANPDPRKSRMTLLHLMTHTAGFACNDYDDASPGNEGVTQGQRAQPD